MTPNCPISTTRSGIPVHTGTGTLPVGDSNLSSELGRTYCHGIVWDEPAEAGAFAGAALCDPSSYFLGSGQPACA